MLSFVFLRFITLVLVVVAGGAQLSISVAVSSRQ
jgi:hypothetical protein